MVNRKLNFKGVFIILIKYLNYLYFAKNTWISTMKNMAQSTHYLAHTWYICAVLIKFAQRNMLHNTKLQYTVYTYYYDVLFALGIFYVDLNHPA